MANATGVAVRLRICARDPETGEPTPDVDDLITRSSSLAYRLAGEETFRTGVEHVVVVDA